jgi:hypothetical protein
LAAECKDGLDEGDWNKGTIQKAIHMVHMRDEGLNQCHTGGDENEDRDLRTISV